MNLEQQKYTALQNIQLSCESNGFKLLYAAVVGSHAYGNATNESDLDVRFVFSAKKTHYLGFGRKDHLSIGGEDVSGYELSKWCKLLLENNPTVMEMLFMDLDSILFLDEAVSPIFSNRKKFLSKKCFYSYLKYSENQIYKAKSCNRETVYQLDIYEDLLKANNVDLKSLSVKQACRNKKVICPPSVLGGEYSGTLGDLIEEYKVFKQEKFPYSDLGAKRRDYLRKHGFDSKNVSHAIRLARTCLDIFKKEELKVHRHDADYFLDIKNGKYDLEYLEKEFESLKEQIVTLLEISNLPEIPDRDFVEALSVQVLEKVLFNV